MKPPRTTNRASAAWGLDVGRSAVRLVRVRRAGRGFEIDRAIEVDRAGRSSGTRAPAEVLRGLPKPAAGEPLVVCFPDDAALFRVLDLPRADPAVLDRMVQSQAEAVLPGQPDRFAWAWDVLPPKEAEPPSASQAILLCAARRDAVNSAHASGAALGAAPAAVVPTILAAATGYLRLRPQAEAGDDTPLLLIDIGAGSGSLAIAAGDGVTRCAVLDSGADDWMRQAAESAGRAPADLEAALLAGDAAAADAIRGRLLPWANSLREVYLSLLEGLPQPQRPRRCVLLGRAAGLPGVAAAVAASLRLPLEVAAPLRLAESGANPSLGLYAAAGAATQALEALPPQIDLLLTRAGDAPVHRGRRWLPVAAGAWLALAVAILYGYERYEARTLADRLERVHRVTSQSAGGGVERRLAIGSYLESSVVAPLDVFGAVSAAAAPGVTLTGWQFARSGAVTFTGNIGGPGELDGFLRKLAESDALEKIEVKRAQADPQGRGWTFEVTAAARPQDRPKAATQPATQASMTTTAPRATSAPAGPLSTRRGGGS